jgi:hypothetical protein
MDGSSMCSMCSMCWGLFSIIGGPVQVEPTQSLRTAHMFSLTPQLLLLSADFAPHPQFYEVFQLFS